MDGTHLTQDYMDAYSRIAMEMERDEVHLDQLLVMYYGRYELGKNEDREEYEEYEVEEEEDEEDEEDDSPACAAA